MEIVIDLLNIADIRNTISKWILPMLRIGSKISSIDPYYTRFDSDLEIVINDSVSRGFGVLEIMDLK